jgi:hypothetical protein
VDALVAVAPRTGWILSADGAGIDGAAFSSLLQKMQ